MRKRKYLSAGVILTGVLLLAAAAIAGPGSIGLEEAATHVPDHVDLPSPTGHSEAGEGEAETELAGPEEPNQGQCVSVAAQDDTEGLDGWHKGTFVSSVAQSELIGEDCDDTAEYQQLRTDAINATSPGDSENGDGDAGAETSQEAKEGKKDFGQSKRAEHAPGS